MRKLPGRLASTDSAVMEIFGRLRGCLTRKATATLNKRVCVISDLARQILAIIDLSRAFRIYSDAAGEGGLANISFFDLQTIKHPILAPGKTDAGPSDISRSVIEIYIFIGPCNGANDTHA